MKDDHLDSQNKNNKRCKREEGSASSSENSDSCNPLRFSKRSRKQFDTESDSTETNSDIDSSFLKTLRPKSISIQDSGDEGKSTDSEAEEEAAVVPNRRRGIPVILSDYESEDSKDGVERNECLTESSESDEDDTKNQDNADTKTQDAASSESSSDWDCQSEKCPICLAKFSQQMIGTPESCDHCFCLDCIQEWAKNVNTCPVDRQPFTLILIRQHLEGKVIRQIQVSQPTNNDEAVSEDATFCEVCGLGDREDRMLLCDACDNGYHMECLNPPLLHVPIEEWHCPECTPLHTLEIHELHPNRVGGNATSSLAESRNRPFPRLLPRTRQSERVQRSLRSRQHTDFQQSTSLSAIEISAGGRRQAYQRGRTKRKTRKFRRKPQERIKRIVTDDGVIEVRLKKKSRRTKKKRKSRTLKSTPRTVKGRLANRLGICKPFVTSQTIPEAHNIQQVSNVPINHQRHQAGIPTLDIFGRRDQLDYFSGSDQEDDVEFEGSFGIISRVRVSRPSDRFISRKKAKTVLSSFSIKKPQKTETISIPADGSLLDSILTSQTLWHSKKSEIKSSSDGSLNVVLPKLSKNGVLKEDDKIDVRKIAAPVIETPMFPRGRANSGTLDQDRGSSNQNDTRNNSERSYEASSHQSPGSAGSGYPSYSSSVGSSPLRGVAPIRFRMNAPPRRPNIHSYPSDNIPPPPPLRLRSPVVEMTFTAANPPDESPPREEEEIDIYSDIEQDNNSNEHEEKSYGTLEPPPEPPFLMTMEPPPEPPAILMNLNEDASDDEASGLVIDDPPPSDVYDPCAINSDESSTGDAPLAKPPELPLGLKDSELVADYSSDSQSDVLTPSYNPELPTFMNTPIFGPLPQPPSPNSSDENDEDCPNFSMYSVASMTLAQRGLPPLPVTNLDIPIPPSNKKEIVHTDIDIPLPEEDSPKSKENEKCEKLLPEGENSLKCIKSPNDDSNDSVLDDKENLSETESILDEPNNKSESYNLNTVEEDGDDEEEDDDDEDEVAKVENNNKGVDDTHDLEKENSNHGENGNLLNVEIEKIKITKGSSEVAEDECSTQGDVLDLVIESENNLEQNIHPDDSEKISEREKSPTELEENDEKNIDGGDKSDGLVDITDEDMSVYDGQDNNEDLDRIDDPDGLIDKNKLDRRSLDSDDNSLVGGATSAISAETINNSDNVQPQSLPGLEGLETETISESEDVNFDELPLEDNEQIETILTEEDHITSRKKKKKKNRKASHVEETTSGIKEALEFEEGEIIDDKPKQTTKKDKKIKNKSDNNTEIGDLIEINKTKGQNNEKDFGDKKLKKKKEKNTNIAKDKIDKSKEPREKTVKPGEIDENIAWKKLSKSTKERNYRDGKEKDEKERDRENKNDNLSKKEKRNKEKRKELERYNVRRLISEKPKRPKKDEFGRDISPSKSGSSLSPYRPPRYRSPLRTRNRSRTRSRSNKSRSRSRGRRRRSRSRDRVRSRDRSRRERSREKSRRSRSQNNVSRSKEKRKTPDNLDKSKNENRSTSRTRRKSRSRSVHSRRRSLSYSKSWTPSWSRSSKSRSQSRRRRRSRSVSRSKSRSWTRDKNVSSIREARAKDPPKNLTVTVTNKEALKKKDKKKLSKKKDDRRKKKRNSPAPSKEVFTSGDNILVSVNFKNANKNSEAVPAGTPLLRESSKRKRDDVDGSVKKKRNTNSKKSPGAKKSSRLTKINEVARNSKPVAIIDLDLSPFREQTPSPKEVIVLSDSGDEGDKQHSQLQDEMDRLGHTSMSQSMLSLSSVEHKQKSSVSQPQSPISSSFILNSSGPKTPPEPHIKFSISTKPSQIRMLSNPLMEAEEEMPDENMEDDINEKLHKGPNTPPEPPPDLNTPASPPTTPYDPFDPTKSRSPSPTPRGSEIGLQLNSIREDKTDNMQKDDGGDHSHLGELHSLTPPIESEDLKQTPESAKVHSTPKSDPNNTDSSPKVSPPAIASELNKVSEDSPMKPALKLLTTNKLDVTVHKSPEKLITVVISQPVKNLNQTPKQSILPLKNVTPIKHSTPKGNAKHQLFSSSLMKQVPMLSSLLPGPPVYTPSGNKSGIRAQQNGDPSDDMDIDLGSPYSPGSSEGDDLFEPPVATPPRNSAKPVTRTKTSSSNKFDTIFGSSPAKLRHGRHASKKKGSKGKSKGNKKEEVKVKLDEDQLKILDDLPSSAVEMQVKDKFLKKLNRQERVVEEIKVVLKPHYAKKHVNKEEYKEILRRSVPKICHNKTGEINPMKIQSLVEAYVKKFRYAKKKASGALPSSGQNKPKPQKTLWS